MRLRKYLENLSKDEYNQLVQKLYDIQSGKCFICGQDIDLKLNSVNVDHIIAFNKDGNDDERNFALTHEGCNKCKLDTDLRIARILHRLKNIQDNANNNNKVATLEDILSAFGGSIYDIKYTIEDNIFKYSFPEIDNDIQKSIIYEDYLSKEKYIFIKVPIEYVYHDSYINPRGINSGISKLIKEFYRKNPQLHLSLARLHEGKIKIFDGQHKAVSQIMLGARDLVLRLFLNPNVERLVETNTNAGSILKQVAFDKAIMRQLNNTLYIEKLDLYRKDKNLAPDDYNFSEQDVVNYFKGDNKRIKKYIIDNLKELIYKDPENKLSNYISKEGGRNTSCPISYSSFDKTFLTLFINSKKILTENMDYKMDEGKNPRYLERIQMVKLMNIIADEIYYGKYDFEIGTSQIEDKIINKKDENITEAHLTAFRMSKEEIMHAWLLYIKDIIENYFAQLGKRIDKTSLFQYEFDERLWQNIRNFIKNLKNLPLWVDKSMALTHFAGKNTYEYWEKVFEDGVAPNGAQVLAKPINITEMIQCNDEY